MRKAKLTGYMILFVCIAGMTIHSAIKKTRSLQRDIPTLLNFYYNYKDKNPLKAKEALDLILKQDSSHAIAILAKVDWFIQQGDTHSALNFLQNMHVLYPHDAHIERGLAELYILLNQMTQAKPILKKLPASENPELNKKSTLLSYLEKNPLEHLPQNHSKPTLRSEDMHWANFYKNKLIRPHIALKTINTLLKLHPNDIRTLKEAAYFAITQKNYSGAIAIWSQLYGMEKNPEYALTIAYLYDAESNKPKAFHFFDLASKTTDMNIKNKAELAMNSMGGSQFKFLPNPYFAEFYTAPFYFSRFDLGVLPTILRAGITVNKNHHTEAYASWQRTKDNSSGTVQGLIVANSIPQLFEDNVAIYAAGLRTNPWPKIPLQTFVEIGQAEDLVYRARAKWRGDVRGGLIYYNTWGKNPSWTTGLTFPWTWVSSLYADTIYYSRYNNNIIGTAWFKPGLRVATFQSASLNFYLANYLILDKNQAFFNNIHSHGPGMAFQPSHRINLIFRLEALQGYYIHVNSPTPNPYHSKYYNNIAMMEVYFRF